MRIFSGFTMFFYTVVFLAMGCALIALSLNIISLDEIIRAMEYSYTVMDARLAIGVVALLLIIYSLVAIQVAFGNLQREKTIAFDNPNGRVTISLSAIEDFIKRSSTRIPEVKELRADVKATKKGINILSRVIVYSDANIPDTTERIQNILKNKVQEMLGIEEPISIRVHVAKIAPRETKESKSSKTEYGNEKKTLFQGIEYGNE